MDDERTPSAEEFRNGMIGVVKRSLAEGATQFPCYVVRAETGLVDFRMGTGEDEHPGWKSDQLTPRMAMDLGEMLCDVAMAAQIKKVTEPVEEVMTEQGKVNVAEKVRQIVIEQACQELNSEQLTNEASFTQDLGVDSLDGVKIVMALEDAFDVEIPDDVAETFLTIGAVVAAIEKHLAD